LKIGVPKEIYAGETRVALVPTSISKLKEKGHEVIVQTGAGADSVIKDEQYEKAGASIVGSATDVFERADVIFKVQPPDVNPETGSHEVEMIQKDGIYIGYMAPFKDPDNVSKLAKRGVTTFAMEFIPRTTLAQSMDSLSSMATLAGYKAVMMAADNLKRIFPMMTTAAGSIAPATVVVLGAGVAGLQAIATAKRLGAKVEAFDPRAEVKEQIESVGGKFIPMEIVEEVQTAGGYAKEQSEDFLRREQEAIAGRLSRADVVITTAQIFGKAAPVLITEEMVKMMPQGAIIVDLAAEGGGNCELTVADEVVTRHDVSIYGETNLPAKLPTNASQMYSKNITTLFLHLYSDPEGTLNFEDEITNGACVAANGEIRNELIKGLVK